MQRFLMVLLLFLLVVLILHIFVLILCRQLENINLLIITDVLLRLVLLFLFAGSVKIYYKDSSTGSELDVLELTKFTNADIQRSNTLTMPDNFGDAGRIYFVFRNTSNSSVSIRVDNFIVNDMTTADLDSSLGKLGDRIKGFFEDLANTIKGFFYP